MIVFFFTCFSKCEKIDLTLSVAPKAKYDGTLFIWSKVKGNNIQYHAYQKINMVVLNKNFLANGQ